MPTFRIGGNPRESTGGHLITRSISAGILLLASMIAHADQVCDLTLTACPKQLPAGPLLVPMDVISLDARIPYCQEMGTIVNAQPASIFFVIDNSTSMGNTDPDEARFSVVTSLLDSIHAASPSTRVGLAIFNNRLSFDTRDNPFFRPAFPGDTTQHDAYVPLIRLDTLFGEGSTRGLDTLKALLRHNNGTLVYNTTRPRERGPAGGGGGGAFAGTDITLGFEAALQAMLPSPSPKEARFIIFLSDGDAGNVDASRQDRMNVFEQGLNTPTTYTIFFNGGAAAVPTSIQTMTTNIQGNGYSSSNPRSAAFSIDLPGAQLQILLQTSVLSQILTVPTTGKSVSVILNGGAPLSTDTRPDSAHFAFTKRMALSAVTTAIEFQYTHTFQDTTVRPPVPRDTIIKYTLNVQRSPQAGALPGTVTKSCREQAALTLHSGGQNLSVVTTSHATLEARLTPTAGQTCADCAVEVSLTGSLDKENLALSPAGAAYGVAFGRLESVTPLPGDGSLQHVASDSIVLTWINPENSLDVVRRSWPFQAQPSSLALFAGDVPVEAVTAHMSGLEARLTRPAGTPCDGCAIQISPSGGADREMRPLAASGGTFNGTFVRMESVTPVPGDGTLQHAASDSIVILWVNPANPADFVRRSYPYVPVPPALALFSGGKQLDTVTSAHENLEIRLTLPGGEPCLGCTVAATSTGGGDQENVAMTGAASPYIGRLVRVVSLTPAAGNGRLEHAAADSLVFTYENPLNPAQRVRRSYPFINFANIAGILPQNSIARTGPVPAADGGQWILSEAPNLVVQVQPGSGICCRVLATPANSLSPDSSRTVGILIEASREFNLDVKVFSHLGEFVNRLAFTVPREEFPKLSPMGGRDARYFRLLWNGQTLNGSPVGTGAYILKTSVTLLPVPGVTDAATTATLIHRVGVLR